MRNGALVCHAGGQATIQGVQPVDAATLGAVATHAAADSPYVPSIVMMRKLVVASSEIDLFSVQRDTRADAARQIDKFFALLDPAIVKRALKHERDTAIASVLTLATATRGLSSYDRADRLAAINAVAEVPSETARTALTNFVALDTVRSDPQVLAAVQSAINAIDTALSFGKLLSILFSGLSYARVLLLTALGLSIVFGLTGVINFAHGEFIMIGATSTYLVERFMQAHLPGLFDAYIFVAIPVAFVISAVCGMLLEYFVIRFLYRRPLETLLATWVVSIALIKLVQVLFGAQNVEFISPGFLNGGVQVSPGFFVTYNRVFAIVLALLIFLATFAVVRLTKLGLLMRATTQLRDMALMSACGISRKSSFGRPLIAVRDDEARMRFLGYRTHTLKLIAWCLSAVIAALAGTLYVPQVGIVNPTIVSPQLSVEVALWVAIGDRGTLIGAIAGAILVNGLKFWLSSQLPEVWSFILAGVTLVIVVAFSNGVWGTLKAAGEDSNR